MHIFTRFLFVFTCFLSFFTDKRLSAQECLSGGCPISSSQYPSGNLSTTSTTFVTVNTLIFAGDWQRYSVTSGITYEWSLCSADGGSASYDSELTLYQDDGSTKLCYSDDNCGDDAKIQWTATYTGFVRTQVNMYDCLSNTTFTTLVWRRVAAPINCSSAVALSCGTPVTSGNLATSGGAYNPPSTTCGFPTPGNEKLYSFTSTSAGTYTLQVNSLNGGTGYMDYFFKPASGGCGPTGWTCIDDIHATGSVTFTLAASTAYYILLDPENASGTINQTFQINCPASAPANDNCSGATNLTPVAGVFTSPGSQTSASATSSGVAIPTCSGGTSSSALDVWYKFTTDPSGGNASVVVTGTGGFDAVVQALSGSCGATTSIGCVDLTASNGTETLNLTSLAASTTYFLRVYGWAGSTGTFTISVSGTALPLDLISFTGKAGPSSNMIQWKTQTEKNVQWHIVERSADGISWTETGRKPGQVDSRNVLEYDLEDKNPPVKAYYRLHSVDTDGAENISTSISIARKTDRFAIEAAFPSPADDVVTIQFSSLNEENISVRLLDMSGRVVLAEEYPAQKNINELQLSLAGFQAGVYLLSLHNAREFTAPVRLVKK